MGSEEINNEDRIDNDCGERRINLEEIKICNTNFGKFSKDHS